LNLKNQIKALIISISDYKAEDLENLEFCKNDGEEMYNTLTNLSSPKYTIQEDQKIIGKVSKKTMESAMIEFFKKAGGDDILLFYFSGHGVGDGHGGRYFATTDVDTNDPEYDGVEFEFLSSLMNKSYAKIKIAILDCCFSGAAFATLAGKAGDDAEKEAEGLGMEGLRKAFGKSQGSCILASSLSNSRSFSLPNKKYSAYTSFILDGLKGKKGAYDENGCVTPDKLSTFVFSELQKIPELANQKPVRNMSFVGELILAEHTDLATQTSSDNLDQKFGNLLKDSKVKKFNELKKKNKNLRLIFDDIDLSGKSLKGANLENVKFRDARLDHINLENANLKGANLGGAYLLEGNFKNANLQNASLQGANFQGASLEGANFQGASLDGANLQEANLFRANFVNTNLNGINLKGAKWPAIGKKRGLVISISDYEDQYYPNLPNCKNDGRKMIETLEHLGYEVNPLKGSGGFITNKELKKMVDGFFLDEAIGPHDLLFFYYSGHGAIDTKDVYFCASDTLPNDPKKTALPMSYLTGVMGLTNAKNLVTIIDSTYRWGVILGK